METKVYCFIPVKSENNLVPLKGFCPTIFESDIFGVMREACKFKLDFKRLCNKSLKIAICPFIDGTVMFSDIVCVI